MKGRMSHYEILTNLMTNNEYQLTKSITNNEYQLTKSITNNEY